MPSAARKPCSHPGCRELIAAKDSRCPSHLVQQRKQYDTRRGSSAARGYDHRWRLRRANHLSGEPLCRMCKAQGRYTVATVADHITPHRGSVELFAGPLQSLCASCHSSTKQAQERRGGRISGALL